VSKLDRAQVAGITARLMSELKQSPATATPLPQLSTAYRSAALVSSFSVDGLEQQGAGEAEVSAVIRDSSAVVQSDGSLRWVLKPDLRMAAVRQIASDVPLPSALAGVTDAPDDPVQRMITNYANGTAPKLDDQDTQQLGASFRVVEWFGEFLPDAPSKDEIAHRLEYRGFVQPFHDLVGENFQGREDELDQLSDYVGVRRASSLKERLARVARRVRNFSERPPLMITGPGGIGKSTLIAKFIVDHTDVGDRPMPFVYIDFDRPLMDAGEPVVVLYDGLHQLSLQFPEARASLMSLRQSWEERFIEAVGTSTRVASKQQTLSGWRPGAPLPRIADRLRIQLVEEFVRVLSVLDVDDRQLLLVLDTFEQVQARSSAELLAMWELLERVQEGHPLLRVVISGRVEYGAMVDDLAGDSKSARERFVTENLPLAGLNRKESESYLVGAELPAKAARQIVKHVVDPKRGASPLTLRVAAAVWAKQRERGATSAEPDDRFWERLKTGRIQAELIARYLHYVDGEIGKLAGPALVLRRLTPDVLINVVAGPAGVDVPSVERAGYLIDELRREVSMLVASRTDHRELVPRQEVQQQVVALMRDLEGDMLRRIHERAIEYFGGIADRLGVDDPAGLDALADEIYHRLALRQDETLIRQRWDARLAGRLDEAVLALDPAERALLATLSDREISASLRREVSQRTWETGAGKRVREYIEVGLYDDALGLLQERTVRSAGSELYLLETVVLLAIGDKLQARAVALAGIDSFDAGGNSAVQIDLLVALVRVELAIGDLDAAGETLERATVLARDRDDGVRLLALQMLRTSFVADGETDSEIDRSAIVELVDAIDDAELRLHLPRLTAAATTVGRDHPSVILRAVDTMLGQVRTAVRVLALFTLLTGLMIVVAASTAARACQPKACWREAGLPYCSVKQGSIASTTRGSTGVVAW